MTTHKVGIFLPNYPGFYRNFSECAITRYGSVCSKRRMRKIIRQEFGLDAHHKSTTSAWTIYLTPADAIAFKLKYGKIQ